MAEEAGTKRAWIKTAAITAAAAVAFIGSTLGLWWNIEGKIKDAVKQSTIQVTKEIKQSTLSVVDMHKDDLSVRIRIIKREIASKQAAGELVPERILLHLDALQDQLSELKDKWYER